MKIKIEIVEVLPRNEKEATPLQINKFEELALFLDCRTIQKIINDFRKRTSIKKSISYNDFDDWKEHAVIKDKLSLIEKKQLLKLDAYIDFHSNRSVMLDESQRIELSQMEQERLKWLNPFYTFSKSLEKRLTLLESNDFYQILIKAIVCGEVRGNDFPNELVKRKGARMAIINERKLYWLYKTRHSQKGIMGYGLVGQKLSIPLQSVRSNIASYKNKLKIYNSSFKQ